MRNAGNPRVADRQAILSEIVEHATEVAQENEFLPTDDDMLMASVQYSAEALDYSLTPAEQEEAKEALLEKVTGLLGNADLQSVQ